MFAEILGLDLELITSFHTILCTISCKAEIDPDKFQAFCLKTAQLYVKLYGKHPMSPSVHKILIHGHEAIRSFPVPIGLLSEEAQEASNKVVKKNRESYARKMSRPDTNTDVLRRLLINSDPVITSKRRSYDNQKVKDLPRAVKDLLI